MTKKDATQVQALLAEYLKKFTIHPELSVAEVRHMFTPKEDIVDSYVVENEEKKITDFISYYAVPCSALKHETIKEYKVRCFSAAGEHGKTNHREDICFITLRLKLLCKSW